MNDIKTIATEYAERSCNGEFPITYTREQVVKHTANDFMAEEKKLHDAIRDLNERWELLPTVNV